jgi:hypothetical protein
LLQPTHQALFGRLWIAPVKVIAAQILIGFFLFDQVVGNNQDGMSYGYQGFFPPSADGQTPILRAQVSIFGM